MDKMMLYLPLALAILGLIFMITKALWVNKQTTGNERMQSISKSIKEGAMAFLNAEYRILGIFVVIAAIALLISPATSSVISEKSTLVSP